MSRLLHDRSSDRRRRWTLAIAYVTLLASCDSPLAPTVDEVSRLDVTPAVLTMVVGGNATLIARVYGPGDALLPTARVFWSSQDPTVVTVDQNGGVIAVAAGTAQIAASSGGQSRTIAVTVSPRPIVVVRINPPAANVVAGQTLALQGEALDGTGAILPNRQLEWTTSAPEIATVSSTGVVTGISIGQATISATGEGKTGSSIITVVSAPVATIVVSPNGGSLPAGGTLMFTATARDANGQPLTGRSFVWMSSNDAVATVSSSGLLTALSPGTVTITVSAPGEGPGGTTPTASVSVTVLIAPVASATIVPSPASLQVGQNLPLTINLFDAGGEPLSPQGRTIDWSTSNAAVATVNLSGTVTGVTVGNATVTATVTTPGQAGSIQATAQITVSNQPVASVVVSPNPAVVHVGYTRAFFAVARNAANQPLPGRIVVWTSSNQSVATVDQGTGLVTGVSQGSAQILATSEGVTGFATVSIDLVGVSSVSVVPATSTLMPGQQVPLAATPRDSAGNAIAGAALGGRTTTWLSLNTAVATVNTTGLVTAVAQGAANITATIGGTSGQAAITVSPLPGATQLAIITQPSATAQNDAAFSTQPVVQLKDASGTNVATAGVVVQAAIASGGGTLGGTLTATTNASGTAVFSDLKITGTIGARTLTFSSGALTPATSGTITLQPGVATQLALTTPPPSTANNGQVFSSASVVRLRDVSGNNVPQSGLAVSAAVSPSAGVTLSGGSATTDGTGAATFSALTLSGPAGNYTLTFSSGSLTPVTSGTIALSAGSGSKLTLTVQPSATVQSGVVFPAQPVVQLRDAANNPVAQAGVVVSVAILTGGGTLGGTTTATTNASGVATFSGLSISGTIGVRTLLFGATGYTTVTSNNVNVTPGAATALTISVQPPSSTPSGSAFSPQPAVQLRDASGNAVSQSGRAISVSLNGAGASLTGSSTANTNASGLATFSGLGLSGTVGTYSLTFASAGLTSVTSNSISLTGGAATQLTITTQPAGANSGTAFTTQPAIQLRDAQGNPASQSGVSVTASIASGPPGATLLGTASATTNAAGLATFSGLGLAGTVGNYTIAFASTGLTGATSGSFALGPGAPASLAIQTQPAGATSGSPLTTQPVIQVRDARSNLVSQVVTVTASVTGGGASLIGSASVQTVGGIATYSGLGVSGLVGNYSLTFAASGVPNETSATFALAAGAASQLAMVTQPSASVASGSALAQAPAVRLRDGAGNLVSQAGVNVTVGIAPSGASLTGSTTAVTNASGIATFTGLGITGVVGNYTLAFSASGLTGTTSNSIAVTPGPASALSITTQPPASSPSGSAFSTAPTVQLRDASGNAVATSGVSIAAALNGPAGGTLVGTPNATTNASGLATFTGLGIGGNTSGSFTITFSSGGLTSATSSSVNVTLPATKLGMVTQPSATAASGVALAQQPSVRLLDASNNPVSQAGVQVSVALAGGTGASLFGTATATTNASGVASFTGLGITGTIGSYSLSFSSSGLTGVSSNTITLSHGAATQVVLTTPPSSTAQSGAPFSTQPTAQLRDAAGNNVLTSGITVTASKLTGDAGATVQNPTATTNASGAATFSGLGITGLAGPYTIRFTGTGVSGTADASVNLTAGAAAQLSITTQPGNARRNVPFEIQPVIQLRDSGGNPVSQPLVFVTAQVQSGSGSLGGFTSVATNGSGVASFSNLSLSATGSHVLRFISSGLVMVVSNAFVVNP